MRSERRRVIVIPQVRQAAKHWRRVGAALLVAVLACGYGLWVRRHAPPPPRPDIPLSQALAALDLSQQQQAQIQNILADERERAHGRIEAALSDAQRAQLHTRERRLAYVSETPRNRVSITTDDNYRYISANGIPDHATGAFPNAHNPNRMRDQSYNYRMPLAPRAQSTATPLGMYPWGVARNGIPFDPLAMEFWNNDPRSGWQYEPLSGQINLGLDDNNAHVQPGGAYHYHGIPTALWQKLDGANHMVLLGYAADGYPLYGPLCYANAADAHSALRPMASSYRLKAGNRPGGNDGPGGAYDGSFVQDYEYVAGSGDLDECNGRRGVTPEYPNGTYYYVLTRNWPVVPRCFRATPDSSFFRRRPPGPGSGGPGGGGPPPFGPPPDGPPPDGPPPMGPPPPMGAPPPRDW